MAHTGDFEVHPIGTGERLKALEEAADHMLVAHESESGTHYTAAIEKLRVLRDAA